MTFLSQFTPYQFPLLGLVRLPEVKVSPEDRAKIGVKPSASNATFLRHLAWQGYLAQRESGRFAGFTEAEVKARLRMEFEVFETTGTIDYFVLLWDISRWCDEQGILRGRGRGSSGGSLAMSFLGITDINSLEHGLHFTRFLSEARLKPKVIDGVTYVDGKMAPDVDGDFEFLRRDEVIKYIEARYPGRVSKISTRLQLTGKTALKLALKAYLEYDEGQAKFISDNIEVHFGNAESLDEALEKRADLRQWIKESPAHARAFAIARGLEGLNVSKGQHPSGVFISYAPLDGNIPVELSKDKEVITTYDMNVAATLGSKVDVLGIRTLDCIATICRMVKLVPNLIDVKHPSIYEYYSRSAHLFHGLFQIGDGLTKDVVVRLQPRDIDELAACVAISRPGALKYIDQYKAFLQTGALKSIHPKLDEILKPTGGIILYQETITEVCQKLFGMTAVEADQVRYYVGKKLKDEMKKTEPILYEKGRANGVPDEVIKYFWDTCNASADYLFVRAHAFEYAYLTAQTTYLKANHPCEFVFAMLQLSKHEPDSKAALHSIIAESKRLGIDILPPDIVKSGDDFTVEENGVRFGLSHIRGISDATMAKLVSFRREFATKFDVFAAAKEAKVNIATLVGLILSGALDSKGTTRTKLALEAQAYWLLTPREVTLVHKLGAGRDLIDLIKDLKTKTDEKGKPYIKESRLATFRRDLKRDWDTYLLNSRSEDFAAYLAERHYLGFSYSNTLHALFARKVQGLSPIEIVLGEPKDVEVSFVAFVDEVKQAIGRDSKKPYARFYLSDESGKIKAMISGAARIESCLQFNGRLPAEGDAIICHGKKGNDDMVWTDSIIIQTLPVSVTRKKVEEKA